MPESVVLIGPMGSGKTTIGRLLARRLGLPFVDLDHEIVAATGAEIPRIFELEGEAGFRRYEQATLDRVVERARTESLVLATGGGAPVQPGNWTRLQQIGPVVWLDLDPAQAVQRTGGGGRPLLDGSDPLERLRELAERRNPVYAQADLRVDASRSRRRVIADILAGLAAR